MEVDFGEPVHYVCLDIVVYFCQVGRLLVDELPVKVC